MLCLYFDCWAIIVIIKVPRVCVQRIWRKEINGTLKLEMGIAYYLQTLSAEEIVWRLRKETTLNSISWIRGGTRKRKEEGWVGDDFQVRNETVTRKLHRMLQRISSNVVGLLRLLSLWLFSPSGTSDEGGSLVGWMDGWTQPRKVIVNGWKWYPQ